MVEVLVVVGIILLLASLLLPLASSARKKAAEPDLVARLRQMDVANRLYMDQEGLSYFTQFGLKSSLNQAGQQALAVLPRDRSTKGEFGEYVALLTADWREGLIPITWRDRLPRQTVFVTSLGPPSENGEAIILNNRERIPVRQQIPYMLFRIPEQEDVHSLPPDHPNRSLFLRNYRAIRMWTHGGIDTHSFRTGSGLSDEQGMFAAGVYSE